MHDLIIIGGGPGGLSAAIYALRAKLDVLLIEKFGLGGQIAQSDIIENYPGFESLSGMELMSNIEKHAKKFGLKVDFNVVKEIIKSEGKIVVKTASGDIDCRSLIIASGATPNKIGVKGESEYTGRGVSYCATCDGPFYKGQDVVVIGGGDTAVKEALYLSKIARKVYVVHRRDRLRAEKILSDSLLSTPNVEFCWNSSLQEISGDMSGVTEVQIVNEANEMKRIKAFGVFIFIGIIPNSDFIDVKKDENKFIEVNDKMETSLSGVFAIGDVRTTPLRQVVTAVGDGAIAAVIAGEHINLIKGSQYPKRKKSEN